MEKGTKFFENRLGYSDAPKGEELHEVLGFNIFEVIKMNKKTFRVSNKDELFVEPGRYWNTYLSEEKLRRHCISKIKSLATGHTCYYKNALIKAYSLLTEEEKTKVKEHIKWKAERDAKKKIIDDIVNMEARLTKEKRYY